MRLQGLATTSIARGNLRKRRVQPDMSLRLAPTPLPGSAHPALARPGAIEVLPGVAGCRMRVAAHGKMRFREKPRLTGSFPWRSLVSASRRVRIWHCHSPPWPLATQCKNRGIFQ